MNSNVNWHTYELEERHAPWKVFLPITGDSAVLAIGMQGRHLASLARSWKNVFVHRCEEKECEWAREQGQSLGHEYCFETIKTLDSHTQVFSAIAVGVDSISECDPQTAFRLLVPGGSVLWVGARRQTPEVSRLVQQRYQSFRRYAILPPHTGKILLPLGDKKSAQAGLSLYSPGKWQNRMVLRLGQLATSMGLGALLSPEHVVVATKPGHFPEDSYLLDWLGKRLDCRLVDATVYSGWTKLILQLIDENGHVVGIAKLADIELGREAIQRESATLEQMGAVPELRERIPGVVTTGEWGGFAVQVQTPVSSESKKYGTRLTSKHQDFLFALSRVDRCEKTLEHWKHWQTLWDWAHGYEFRSKETAEAVRVALENCADRLGKNPLLFHRVHGDFTPWHVLAGKDGIHVVDWEESDECGLPLSDAFHFAMAREIRLKHRNLPIKNPSSFASLGLEFAADIHDLQTSLHLVPENAVLAILYEYMLSTVYRRDL